MGTALAGSHSRAEDRATAELETCQLGAYGMLHTAKPSTETTQVAHHFPIFLCSNPMVVHIFGVTILKIRKPLGQPLEPIAAVEPLIK